MIQRRDSVPHFDVTTIDGRSVQYAAIWQRRNLVLVALAGSDDDEAVSYSSQLTQRIGDVSSDDTECVITHDHVSSVPAPAVLVADRWGEVCFVAAGRSTADLPPAEEVIEWLRYVQMRCPECEGETR